MIDAMMEGFSGRTLSFFGLGHQIEHEHLTSQQAIVEAGLDWDVKLEPVYRKKKGGATVKVDDRFLIVRQDNDTVLGNVGKAYVPLQNRDAFVFADMLVEGGRAEFVAAGQLKGGKQIFMVAKLGDTWSVLDGDEHEMYVIFRSGHDGGRAVQELITPVRISCLNMMSIATRRAHARVSVVHSAKMETRLQEANVTLARVAGYAEEYGQLAQRLAGTRLTDKRLRVLLDDILPDRPKIEEVKNDIIEVRHASPALDAHRGDAWGALNAATEYFEHGRRGHGREGRFVDVTEGYARRVRNQLAEVLDAAA